MGDVDTVRAIERAPLRTVRPQQLSDVLANPARTIDRLVTQGAITKLAKGVYTAPPDGRDGRAWRPAIEAAGLAVATARFGDRRAILMGLGAARHWAAIPRAIGVTTVAIAVAGRPPIALEHGGTVHLIARDLDRLEAVLEPTELGRGLVTTPAQTMYDLLMKPRQGGQPEVALEAAENLAPRVLRAELQQIVTQAGRANNRIRQMLNDLESTRR